MSARKNVKKGYTQKAYSTRRLAQMGAVQAFRQQVRGHNLAFPRMMGSMEKKNIDASLGFPAFTVGTGVLTLLNASQAGALPTNRVGRRIKMTSVLLRGQVTMAPTSTGGTPIRIIVFYDKQTNKLAPGVTDLLDANDISAKGNLGNSHRFRVLKEIVIPCVGTAGPQSAYINEYFKLAGLETEYIDGTGSGDITDITSGSLYACVFTHTSIGTATLQSDLQTRVRFVDA